MFAIKSIASDNPGYLMDTQSNGSYTKDLVLARKFTTRAEAETQAGASEKVVQLILFPLGRLVATPGALEALKRGDMRADLKAIIGAHMTGEWGEVCDEDKQANNDALKYGNRLLSAYTLPCGEKVWVITEADRSSTTVLLPEEY